MNLNKALELLSNKYRVKTILTDTGRNLGNFLLNQGLVSEISLLIHPIIVGNQSYNMFSDIDKNLKLKLFKKETLEKEGIIYKILKEEIKENPKFSKKMDKVRFIFDKNRFEILHNSLEKNNIKTPLFIGILPIVSARNADFLHNEIPGMIIPKSTRERLYKYDKKEDQKSEGQQIAIEFVEQLIPYKKNYYFISQGNKVETIVRIINNLKLKINI